MERYDVVIGSGMGGLAAACATFSREADRPLRKMGTRPRTWSAERDHAGEHG